MKSTLLKLSYVFLLSTLVFSCSPEDGEDGAIGPQGEQGPQGEPGLDGEDGQDGNAEVIYSAWIPANFEGTSTSVKYMNIDFPSTLPSAFSIKSTHVVLVYFTGYGDGNVYLLPILNFRGAQFTYGFGSGSAAVEDIYIRAEALSGDLTEYQIDPARGAKLRYVIIPPNVLTGKQSTIDYSDYKAVMDYFEIAY